MLTGDPYKGTYIEPLYFVLYNLAVNIIYNNITSPRASLSVCICFFTTLFALFIFVKLLTILQYTFIDNINYKYILI